MLCQCAAVKLPNADKAVVERDKVAGYLRNAAHPDNGGKAAFFEGLGFCRSELETLVKALKKLARQAEITESATSPHGEKYVIVGQVESPTGKAANVQSRQWRYAPASSSIMCPTVGLPQGGMIQFLNCLMRQLKASAGNILSQVFH